MILFVNLKGVELCCFAKYRAGSKGHIVLQDNDFEQNEESVIEDRIKNSIMNNVLVFIPIHLHDKVEYFVVENKLTHVFIQ